MPNADIVTFEAQIDQAEMLIVYIDRAVSVTSYIGLVVTLEVQL